MSAAVVVMAMSFFGIVSLALVGVALMMSRSKETTESTIVAPTEISEGSRYVISKNGEYIAQDFDSSRGKGKMCDAKNTTSKDNAAPFKFTKSGDFWTVATDCDGDGNFTSYLTGTSDLIAARDKKDDKTQRWKVECSNRMDGNANIMECGFRNRKQDKYLNGTSYTSPSYGSEKQLYRLDIL